MNTKSENLCELTTDELIETEGGETFFYYVGYFLGWSAHAYQNSQLQMTLATGSNMRR
ncbi:MAG TPA: hypothetical protein VK470_10785 [Bacteroidota bacterium]|nr:hypothetical protein [Bacteroidota bacterium]